VGVQIPPLSKGGGTVGHKCAIQRDIEIKV